MFLETSAKAGHNVCSCIQNVLKCFAEYALSRSRHCSDGSLKHCRAWMPKQATRNKVLSTIETPEDDRWLTLFFIVQKVDLRSSEVNDSSSCAC